MSSTERVRAFRARNPGYDRRWKRARGKLRPALLAAQQAFLAAQQAAQQPAQPEPVVQAGAAEAPRGDDATPLAA